jgi:hypothetical protein
MKEPCRGSDFPLLPYPPNPMSDLAKRASSVASQFILLLFCQEAYDLNHMCLTLRIDRILLSPFLPREKEIKDYAT